MSLILVYRRPNQFFNSIENVFNGIAPFLNAKKIQLPHDSTNFLNRLRNIYFLYNKKNNLIHITGHDHYLLWYPFKNAILTIHDIEALNRKSGWRRWIFKLLWYDIPIRNAKAVTSISEFSKKEIQSLSNYRTPIKVIYNPISLPLTYSSKTFNTSKPRILHIGTKKNKNLIRLIQALKDIPCKLIVIGHETEAFQNQAQTLKLDCTFKSNLSNEGVMDEYKACDILAFVSTYEGFGLPIIEAQALGRPVLTSTISSMPEVAGEGALFVDPFSVSEIRKGLLTLINDEQKIQELIIKGLQNVKRFDPEVIANEYKTLYNQLALNS